MTGERGCHKSCLWYRKNEHGLKKNEKNKQTKQNHEGHKARVTVESDYRTDGKLYRETGLGGWRLGDLTLLNKKASEKQGKFF